MPAPDAVPLNGPRHRAPDPIELPEPEPDTDPADVLEEEVPLGAVAEFLPATPQRRPVPLEGVNGVSVTLDWTRYLFINVDLSVYLERMPVGEWICLDAVTRPQPNGVGVADTMLLDERGRIGRGLQSLLIGERD